jgi:hypothetical protein
VSYSRGNSRTSPAGNSDVRTGRSTSSNDQSIITAGPASRNGILLRKQECLTVAGMFEPALRGVAMFEQAALHQEMIRV